MEYQDLVEEFGFDLWPIGDRQKGRIGSAMPAWYFAGHLEEEHRNLDNQRAVIDRGGVAPENLHGLKQQLARDQMKLDMIKDSFPKPDAPKKDKLMGVWKELGAVLTQSMFSLSDMDSGRASPHEELRRSKDPVVPIPRHLAKWIIYCNGNVFGGDDGDFRIKRDDGIRAWRMAGRILGESTWSEDLRPTITTEGARLGDYKSIFTGFEPEQPTDLTIKEEETQLQEPQLAEGADLLDERTCVDCDGPMDGEHHKAKSCTPCRDERKQANGRKDTNKNVGGGT